MASVSRSGLTGGKSEPFQDTRKLGPSDPGTRQEGGNADQPLRTSRRWETHKKDMDRMGAAVARGITASERVSADRDMSQDHQRDRECINLSLDYSSFYRILWEACCLWKV
jgi:hypothetical protein